jgi:hypothetical protein
LISTPASFSSSHLPQGIGSTTTNTMGHRRKTSNMDGSNTIGQSYIDASRSKNLNLTREYGGISSSVVVGSGSSNRTFINNMIKNPTVNQGLIGPGNVNTGIGLSNANRGPSTGSGNNSLSNINETSGSGSGLISNQVMSDNKDDLQNSKSNTRSSEREDSDVSMTLKALALEGADWDW